MPAKPVVVGVDGSDESLRAVEWAAREAAARKAPLRIVSAAASPPRARTSLLAQRAVGNAVRGMTARALAEGITRAEEVAPGLCIDADLLEPGTPAVTVTGAGADASMLVLGARGTGGFAAMLLGSVSRYAASHGPCPVVVVRERTMAVHRSVIVGVREPGAGTDAVAFAFEEAARRGAELVVVHVVHPRPGDDARQALAVAEDDLAEALRPWRDERQDVCVRHDVVQGHPAQVLSRYCRASPAWSARSPEPGPAKPGAGHRLRRHRPAGHPLRVRVGGRRARAGGRLAGREAPTTRSPSSHAVEP
jgi:nucleotide-binding universal stress UspA family protein